jgi:4-amino-4-deoxy-L-arabinose transferase-like glycosyltransferase
VPFIAAQLCTLLALWSVWKLGRTVLDERLALVAVFSTLPILFFACKPIWFNQNNVLIAFWALTIYFVFQAFQTSKMRYWIGAGIALGLAFHAKYPAIFLVISILAYMFMRQEGRKHFRTPGPYITTLIALLIFLPHIVWLYHHDFVTFSYASIRRSVSHGLAPLSFWGGQLLYLSLPLLVLIPAIGFAWNWKIQRYEHNDHAQNKARECEKLLFYCAVIPLFIFMLYAGGKGVYVQLEYGAPLWTFFGLWLLLRFKKTERTLLCFRQVIVLTSAVVFFITVGFAMLFFAGQQHTKLYRPTRELGTVCDQLWHSCFDVRCPYIAGSDFELTGHVAHAMTIRPSVIMPQGTWSADDADLNRKGGMIVWERMDDDTLPESLRHRFPAAEVLPEAPDLPYFVGREERTLKIGVAIVPPPREK